MISVPYIERYCIEEGMCIRLALHTIVFDILRLDADINQHLKILMAHGICHLVG